MKLQILKRAFPGTIVAVVVAVSLGGCLAPKPLSTAVVAQEQPTAAPTTPQPTSPQSSVGAQSCDSGATAFLLATATANGTSVTPIADPVAAGFPTFVPRPACAIFWTNSHALPSYAGLYPHATDVDFESLVTQLTAAGIESRDPGLSVPGISKILLLAHLSGGSATESGTLVLIDTTPSKGISSPSIMLTWERILL